VSCEARLTTVEGEAAAAVKKARAAEALVAELKVQAMCPFKALLTRTRVNVSQDLGCYSRLLLFR
jgi:hypothetical protein